MSTSSSATRRVREAGFGLPTTTDASASQHPTVVPVDSDMFDRWLGVREMRTGQRLTTPPDCDRTVRTAHDDIASSSQKRRDDAIRVRLEVRPGGRVRVDVEPPGVHALVDGAGRCGCVQPVRRSGLVTRS